MFVIFHRGCSSLTQWGHMNYKWHPMAGVFTTFAWSVLRYRNETFLDRLRDIQCMGKREAALNRSCSEVACALCTARAQSVLFCNASSTCAAGQNTFRLCGSVSNSRRLHSFVRRRKRKTQDCFCWDLYLLTSLCMYIHTWGYFQTKKD